MFFLKQRRLTDDDSIVGSLVDGAVKLDDVSVAEDAEDFSLKHREKNSFIGIINDFKLPQFKSRRGAMLTC